MKITDMTLCGLSSALADKTVSSVEATEACLEAIERKKYLGNFITVCAQSALDCARRADEKRARGEAISPLCGVPLAVKDNIVTADIRTTCASRMLSDFVPPYDAAVVERLKAAGAVILGKTNMDEYAMGSTDETSAFGAVKNASDPARVPGGSSGGSANCVAARQAFGALGSDTGGSIRQPAAYCGVVGLKPTYSAVSRYGLIAHASSLDQIGTLTRDCDDALMFLNAIAGADSRDGTSTGGLRLPDALPSEVRGVTVGIADEFFGTDQLDPRVLSVFESAVKALSCDRVKVKRIKLPTFPVSLAVYYAVSTAEASSNLARFDGVRYGRRGSGRAVDDMMISTRTENFGDEVKRRIMTGGLVLTHGVGGETYYARAAKIRTVITREIEAALCDVDYIISPSTPYLAPLIGEQSDPEKTYVSDMYTVPANLSGLPALGVPCGAADGLPVGMQIIGKRFSEAGMLALGKEVERRCAEYEPRDRAAGTR